MALIAKRPMLFRGVRYSKGDTVPAEDSKNRNALLLHGKLKHIPDDGAAPAEPVVDLQAMKRDELNIYALDAGVYDPEQYPNKAVLIAAILNPEQRIPEPDSVTDQEDVDEHAIGVDEIETDTDDAQVFDSDDGESDS